MPLQATSGAASYDAFGGGVAAEPNYIESCFSTYLYTGNGSTQTITNGIDLAGNDGLVWIKRRDSATIHTLFDTERGATNYLQSNAVDAQSTNATMLTAFNANGFSLGADGNVNRNTNTFASWTFRKQPKFFDVVTYSGTSSNQTISHNLGSVPGCIMIKTLNAADDWMVYHRSTTATQYLSLNQTIAAQTLNSFMNNTEPTSTVFTVGTTGGVNNPGTTYVAYLFAHDAGGFGLTGTDNVISCGSFTSDGSGNASVTLGYEPQFVLLKSSSATGNWNMFDTMRDMSFSNTRWLIANTSDAENSLGSRWMIPNATGFSSTNGNLAVSTTYIYIAIRRGPMKVPTSGTSVFATVTGNGSATVPAFVSNFPVDLGFERPPAAINSTWWADRLRGTPILASNTTNAESGSVGYVFDSNVGFVKGTSFTSSRRAWMMRRAPSFFDVVCYTGTGSATTFSHNLGVAPEMMIVKNRSNATSWAVYSPIGATKVLTLNTTNAETTFSGSWNNTAPTSSVFTVGNSTGTNQSGSSMVAYLFATCAGVSKVFSYTGNGSSQTINCGFTGGARWILIKRTDSTGDWYVWDSARGIVSGNDPHLSLNSTDAEVTSDDTIDTDSTGFVVNQVSATNVNVSSATYIGIAIA